MSRYCTQEPRRRDGNLEKWADHGWKKVKPHSLASSPTKEREPEGLALLSTIHSPFSSPRMSSSPLVGRSEHHYGSHIATSTAHIQARPNKPTGSQASRTPSAGATTAVSIGTVCRLPRHRPPGLTGYHMLGYQGCEGSEGGQVGCQRPERPKGDGERDRGETCEWGLGEGDMETFSSTNRNSLNHPRRYPGVERYQQFGPAANGDDARLRLAMDGSQPQALKRWRRRWNGVHG